MLAADGVRDQPFLDELQPVVLVLAGVVEVVALEEPAFVAAAVRVEVLEREPLAGRELIGEVADDAELRLLRAGLHVVVARVLELALAGDAEEAPILLDVLLLVGVRHAGDDAELAEAIAERGAPVLPGLAVLVDRPPLVPEQPAELGDLVRRVADVRRVDALRTILLSGMPDGQRARAVVEAPDVAAAERAERNALRRSPSSSS